MLNHMFCIRLRDSALQLEATLGTDHGDDTLIEISLSSSRKLAIMMRMLKLMLVKEKKMLMKDKKIHITIAKEYH